MDDGKVNSMTVLDSCCVMLYRYHMYSEVVEVDLEVVEMNEC